LSVDIAQRAYGDVLTRMGDGDMAWFLRVFKFHVITFAAYLQPSRSNRLINSALFMVCIITQYKAFLLLGAKKPA
jgi:hypothetical protein